MGQTLTEILRGVAIGAPAGAGFLQARGIQQSANAAAQAGQFNATLARQEGAAESSRIRRQGQRTLAESRRLVAQGGVELVGSPLQHIADQAAEIERQAMHAQLAAESTARLDEARARGARAAGKRQSATAILTGGTRALGTGLSLFGKI